MSPKDPPKELFNGFRPPTSADEVRELPSVLACPLKGPRVSALTEPVKNPGVLLV